LILGSSFLYYYNPEATIKVNGLIYWGNNVIFLTSILGLIIWTKKIKDKWGIVETRKHLAWYVRGFAGAAELRSRLVRVESLKEIKEILRLKYECGLSERQIALSCRLSRSTVADYVRKATAARVTWPEAAKLTDAELEDLLFPAEHIPSSVVRPPPDCQYIYDELRAYRKFNLTLSQLWLEYKEKHADGYQYTQFCEYYRRWRKRLDYCMRQEHRAGEKLFIDFSDGLSVLDPATGELIPTQLFLAVWGASNYAYGEATLPRPWRSG